MKHIKKFESFKINEEISMKSVFPIIVSLFLSLQSFGRGYSGSSPGFISKEYVMDDLSNIENDLEGLKNSVSDPELVDLISRVQDLKDGRWYKSTQGEIPRICQDLQNFSERNDIYDKEISDSLNHIKSQDIKELKKDYQILLNKYETAKSSDNKLSLLIMIGLILFVIAAMFYFYKTLNV
jgi:hypothetical protein